MSESLNMLCTMIVYDPKYRQVLQTTLRTRNLNVCKIDRESVCLCGEGG
jgi:hypothetical protein